MTRLLVYWCMGCVVIGAPLGARIDQCPTEKIEWPQMAAAVAIWPAVLAAAFMLKPDIPKTACAAATSSSVTSKEAK
jgi:hypothetical protein